MAETFPGQNPAPPEAPASQSRFAGAMDKMKQAAGRAAEWSAPVANEVLRQETGTDAYDFVGAEQPELNKDQRFGVEVARFALRRVGERIAENRAAIAPA